MYSLRVYKKILLFFIMIYIIYFNLSYIPQVNIIAQICNSFNQKTIYEIILIFTMFWLSVVSILLIKTNVALQKQSNARKVLEKSIKNNEININHLLNLAQGGLVFIDNDYCVLLANSHIAKMLGYTVEEMAGKKIKIYVDTKNININNLCDQYCNNEITGKYDLKLLHKNGFPIDATITFTVIKDDDDKKVGAIWTIIDNTLKIQTESELQKKNRILLIISELDHVLIRSSTEFELLHEACKIIVNKGKYLFCWIGRIDNYKKNEIIPITYSGYENHYFEIIKDIIKNDSEDVHEPISRAIKEEKTRVIKNVETNSNYQKWRGEALNRGYKSIIIIPLKTKTKMIGCLAIYSGESEVFDKEEKSLLIKVAKEISLGMELLHGRAERNQMIETLEASEQRYKKVIEDQTEIICRFLPDGTITFCNNAYCNFFSLSLDQVFGSKFYQHDENIQNKCIPTKGYASLHKRKPVLSYETEIKTKSNKTKWIHWTIRAIINNLDKITEYQAVGLDITDRKIVEEKLKLSLEEKEILLKEIHHRVKNNMQIISSLLDLQAMSLKDEKIRMYFIESRNRVKSMALVHEKLYKSENISSIDFSEYIRTLVSHLLVSYHIIADKVDFEFALEEIYLEVDRALPCAQIINEIISNSLKYAFVKTDTCKILIKLKKLKNGQCNLQVHDNGIGIPEHIDFENTQTLGLQLINALSNQLGAAIKLTNKNGTKYNITF